MPGADLGTEVTVVSDSDFGLEVAVAEPLGDPVADVVEEVVDGDADVGEPDAEVDDVALAEALGLAASDAAAVRVHALAENVEVPTADSALTRKQTFVDAGRPVTDSEVAEPASGVPTSDHFSWASWRWTT